MNDPGIVAATFPPANPLRTPFGKPRPAEIAHTSQGSNFHITVCHFSHPILKTEMERLKY